MSGQVFYPSSEDVVVVKLDKDKELFIYVNDNNIFVKTNIGTMQVNQDSSFSAYITPVRKNDEKKEGTSGDIQWI